jgi:hypothetical protein
MPARLKDVGHDDPDDARDRQGEKRTNEASRFDPNEDRQRDEKGLSSIVRPFTAGWSRWFSNCWYTMKKIVTTTPASGEW